MAEIYPLWHNCAMARLTARNERLEQALRENLMKRKQQERARTESPDKKPVHNPDEKA
jgi:hypothetical protein